MNINEDDPDYDPNKKFMNFKWVPTGKKGKFIHHKITKHVEIYPETWDGDWKDWPTLRIHFVDGIIKDFNKIQ
jgi:hypothetical protein